MVEGERVKDECPERDKPGKLVQDEPLVILMIQHNCLLLVETKLTRESSLLSAPIVTELVS